MLKKTFILVFIGSLGANFFSIFILDKALFYRKTLTHLEESFPNKGLHIRTVKELADTGIQKTAVFIGGSFVKFWYFPDDLSVKISNQGGLENKIRQDYEKMQNDIVGSGIDYVFINSGFCEIHNAVYSDANVDAMINNNFLMFKKIIKLAQEDNITPVVSTLTPVRSAFLFPYSRFFSFSSATKDLENRAFEKYNIMLRKYAADNNLNLIDFHQAVEDKDGQLKKEFSITDGEHIDIDGYEFLNNFLREEVDRIVLKK